MMGKLAEKKYKNGNGNGGVKSN